MGYTVDAWQNISSHLQRILTETVLSSESPYRGYECWRQERGIYSLGHLHASGSQEVTTEGKDNC